MSKNISAELNHGQLTVKTDDGIDVKYNGVEDWSFNVSRSMIEERDQRGEIVNMKPGEEMTITLQFKVKTRNFVWAKYKTARE